MKDLIEKAAEQLQSSQQTDNTNQRVDHEVEKTEKGSDLGNQFTKNAITLNLDKLRQAGMIVPDTSRSAIKEEFRHIKRPLLLNIAGKGKTFVKHPNLIMVSSARASEGKTFSAMNLALSIASERDKTVLLVDADVVQPSVSKFLDIKTQHGLVDYLVQDDLELSDLLVKTDLPDLSILPAGNPHHLSTELLASEHMERLAEELSERYSDRVIIFDSPPLNLTSEANVLASLMGQIVIVVESNQTTKSQLELALSHLNPDPETAVGMILNKCESRDDMRYYEYGYDYLKIEKKSKK